MTLRHETSFTDTQATLVIRDTELSDEATYMCKAANKLGTVDTQATLTMHGTGAAT